MCTAKHLRAMVGGAMGWCAHSRHELDMEKCAAAAAMVVRPGRAVGGSGGAAEPLVWTVDRVGQS